MLKKINKIERSGHYSVEVESVGAERSITLRNQIVDEQLSVALQLEDYLELLGILERAK